MFHTDISKVREAKAFILSYDSADWSHKNYTCTLKLHFIQPLCEHWHAELISRLIHDFIFICAFALRDRLSPTAVGGRFVTAWVGAGHYPKRCWLWGMLSAPGCAYREKEKHGWRHVGVKQRQLEPAPRV